MYLAILFRAFPRMQRLFHVLEAAEQLLTS